MLPLRFAGGAVFRHAREAKGLPREALALQIHRTAGTIELYEAGKVRPPSHVLLGLAAILDLDLADLDPPVEVVA